MKRVNVCTLISERVTTTIYIYIELDRRKERENEMPRETFIVNRRGETLAGILTTANRQGDASYESREKRLAIMCHGFMETRDTFILRRLSTALLEAESSGVDAVFRFDFGGACWYRVQDIYPPSGWEEEEEEEGSLR